MSLVSRFAFASKNSIGSSLHWIDSHSLIKASSIRASLRTTGGKLAAAAAALVTGTIAKATEPTAPELPDLPAGLQAENFIPWVLGYVAAAVLIFVGINFTLGILAAGMKGFRRSVTKMVK